jgi:glycerol-3-phosphate acyltransferase PlsY
VLVLAAIGYLLGSIPFGLLLTRAAGLGDIRKVGSGNIGATNVLRTGRKGLALATLLLDGAKGAAAVLLGLHIAGVHGGAVAGLAAVLGHLFPIWLRFRGGKGVATGFGVLIAAAPLAGLASGAVWLAVAFATKLSSGGALSAFLAAPFLAWALGTPRATILLAAALALLVWARHHANIRRLLAGTEPRIGGGAHRGTGRA